MHFKVVPRHGRHKWFYLSVRDFRVAGTEIEFPRWRWYWKRWNPKPQTSKFISIFSQDNLTRAKNSTEKYVKAQLPHSLKRKLSNTLHCTRNSDEQYKHQPYIIPNFRICPKLFLFQHSYPQDKWYRPPYKSAKQPSAQTKYRHNWRSEYTYHSRKSQQQRCGQNIILCVTIRQKLNPPHKKIYFFIPKRSKNCSLLGKKLQMIEVSIISYSKKNATVIQ